ncbi:MAG: hypothetical protein ACP5LQ_05885 [Candidatus Methanodesulfokora sp.]|mgnify:CR=1 FL=1
MLHLTVAQKWTVAFLLLITIIAYLAILRTREPLLTYTRSGGIAGFRDTLIVYQDGEVVLSSKTQTINGRISEEDLKTLKAILEELRPMGGMELKPKENVADFFSYSIESGGLRISWVDPWASQQEVPPQLNTLNSLFLGIIGKLPRG